MKMSQRNERLMNSYRYVQSYVDMKWKSTISSVYNAYISHGSSKSLHRTLAIMHAYCLLWR